MVSAEEFVSYLRKKYPVVKSVKAFTWARPSLGRFGTVYAACWSLSREICESTTILDVVLRYLDEHPIVTETSAKKEMMVARLPGPVSRQRLFVFGKLWEDVVLPVFDQLHSCLRNVSEIDANFTRDAFLGMASVLLDCKEPRKGYDVFGGRTRPSFRRETMTYRGGDVQPGVLPRATEGDVAKKIKKHCALEELNLFFGGTGVRKPKLAPPCEESGPERLWKDIVLHAGIAFYKECRDWSTVRSGTIFGPLGPAFTEGVGGSAKRIVVNECTNTNIRCHCIRAKINARAALLSVARPVCGDPALQREVFEVLHTNMESLQERKERIGQEKLAYIQERNKEREDRMKMRAERKRRISLIPVRFDVEVRWGRRVLVQQARSRGINSVMEQGTRQFTIKMNKDDIIKRIMQHDNNPASFDMLKQEAKKRGIAVGRATQRELRMKLIRHDDKIPMQPELIDIGYASASEGASEADGTGTEGSDSESEKKRSGGRGKNKRVTFSDDTKKRRRKL